MAEQRTLWQSAPELPAAKPFLKWVGGKRQLLQSILPKLPELKSGRTYHEPFIGGGAVFFALKPKRARLSDANLELIRTYRGVRDSVSQVIEYLKQYPYEKAFFLYMRASRPTPEHSDAEVAARFIYLNRTCFNGLYRVNKKGEFNVPCGRYTNPLICDETNLRACSEALLGYGSGHGIVFQDFAEACVDMQRGDIVYFDPPYVPLSATSNFTGYSEAGFNDVDQVRLRDAARELKGRGVFVLLSNSAAPRVRELYAEGFTCVDVDAKRALNSKGNGRGKIKELLIY